MLLAVITCIAGIIIENLKWPQDRSATRERFIESERAGEKASLLIGLVLGHSVVRWLVAFAAAALFVRAFLELPALQLGVKSAIAGNRLSPLQLDAAIGLGISALMVLLAAVARRIGR